MSDRMIHGVVAVVAVVVALVWTMVVVETAVVVAAAAVTAGPVVIDVAGGPIGVLRWEKWDHGIVDVAAVFGRSM